ncbi:hypothetical protein ACFL2S_04440 [Thermodesulfobacteriota bacterium]
MLNILQSFLAFAATMLVLATLVTIIIEIVARIFRRRYRVFTHLLHQLFNKELQPLIEEHIKTRGGVNPEKIEDELEGQLNTFLDDIRNSPLKPQKDRNPLTWFGGWLRWFGADRSAKLTTEEFIRRFARSQIGRGIYQQTAGRIDKLIDSVCLRYEELSDAMREYIKNSSSVLSIAIGIILALMINIDAHRLFNFYVQNPDMAEKVAENATTYADAYKDAQQRLNDALAALDREKTVSAESKAATKQEIEALKKRLKTVPASVAALKAKGIPIGFDYFPYCRFRNMVKVDTADVYPCEEADQRYRAITPAVSGTDLWPDYLLWVIKVIITGVLIGLGGPFWYDAVRGLARATQMLRGREEPQRAPAGSLPGEKTPAKPAEIFKRYVEKDDILLSGFKKT